MQILVTGDGSLKGKGVEKTSTFDLENGEWMNQKQFNELKYRINGYPYKIAIGAQEFKLKARKDFPQEGSNIAHIVCKTNYTIGYPVRIQYCFRWA